MCGNPDVVRDENENDFDESWTLNWVQCEVCLQWFHQECLGVNIDISDFICSEKCVKQDNGKKNKKTIKRTATSSNSNNSKKRTVSRNDIRVNNNTSLNGKTAKKAGINNKNMTKNNGKCVK